jgi:sulfoxide reductase heme-binding subunit YedZ
MSIVDPMNRFARWLPTWVVYLVYFLPAPWLLYLGFTGGLGREPIKALEHELGEIALQLLIIGLCISPLRRFFNLNLLKFRRAVGLMAFFYVVLHLLVWAVLDVQIVSQMWADIVKRPYVTVGMASFVLMIPLAVTSNNRAVRKLGPVAWRNLHKLTYVIAVLGAVHFIWLRRGFQIEPILYLVVILILLSFRVFRRKA